jgi:hypothetical protein
MKDYPILVGSAADPTRVPLDVDFIGSYSSIQKLFRQIKENSTGRIIEYPVSDSNLVLKADGIIFEASIAWSGSSNAEIVEYVQGFVESKQNPAGYWIHTAPSHILWLLKESHKYKDSVHFEKNRLDVIRHRRAHGGIKFDQFFPKLVDMLKRREDETYRPAVKLNVSKDDFFSNDGIDYTICPHDDIHKIVKIADIPAYERIKIKEQDVLCSKKLWDISSHFTRFYCVIEEARVIAIERGVLPFGLINVTDEVALKLFKTALQKICTTLCSGWFREFAWDNYDEIINHHLAIDKSYDDNYINRFNKDWKK